MDAKLTLTAVDETGRVFDSVRGKIQDLERVGGALRTTLGALAAGLSAGALVNFVRGTIDAADALNKLAQKTGVAVETLSELQYAAKLSDVSNEQLGDGLRKLAVSLQAAAGGAKNIQEAFRIVGIETRELATIPLDQALARIADAFARSRDDAAKTALAVQLFGRSGDNLIPLLNSGSEGLRRFAAEARQFGVVVDSGAAAAAERFNDNVTRLTSNVDGLLIAMADGLLPTLNSIIEKMIEATKQGGLMAGMFAGLGQASKALVFDSKSSPAAGTLAQDRQELLAYRAELEKLLKLNQQYGTGDIGFMFGQNAAPGLDAFMMGEMRNGRERQNKIRQLELTIKQYETSINKREGAVGRVEESNQGNKASLAINKADAIEVTAKLPPPPPFRGELPLPDRGTLNDYLDEKLQSAKDQLDELEQTWTRDLVAAFDEAASAMARADQNRNESIQRLVDQTPTGQFNAALQDLQVLDQALKEGRISTLQWGEAYELLNKRAFDALSGAKESVRDFSDATLKALRDLEFAIEAWGRRTTETIAVALETGKLDFRAFVDSVLKDLSRLLIQNFVVGPIFKGIQGAASGFFGGGRDPFATAPAGRAIGGPVSAGTPYLVGEIGPELFVPRQSGTIVPNSGLGANIYQTINIDARSDIATVRAAVRDASRLAQAEMARASLRG